MPELPEIEVTRLGFASQIPGATIHSVCLGKPLRWPLGVDAAFLVGQNVHQVRRRGKYLLLDLDHGLLLIHLGMSGRLVFGANLPERNKHDHFEMQTTHGLLRLHDPRRFGAVVWSAAEDSGMAQKLLQGLGMEPLAETFNVGRFVSEVKKHKAAIKQVLMSGRIVVGVGNIYANEALFLSGVNPRISACKISQKRLTLLAGHIQALLAQAIALGGTTLKDFRNPAGWHGLFQNRVQVYGRGGEPCVVCGHEIRSVRLGQRSTFFCSHCQK